MSSTATPRVVRKNKPRFTLFKTTYAKALPYLLKDFGERCAYSLQHDKVCSMEVDHFDPSKKNNKIQHYDNLFPASDHCNRAKTGTSPRPKGDPAVHLLNCCKDADYNHVIFENPETHELVGTTPAAIFHIDVCDLNAPHLVLERAERSRYWNILERHEYVQFSRKASFTELAELIHAYIEMVEKMIPKINPPPMSHKAVHPCYGSTPTP